jgi:hypothetical protein
MPWVEGVFFRFEDNQKQTLVVGGEGFLCFFSLVLKVFSSCSHQFLKLFPIASQFYVYGLPQFNSHVHQLKRSAKSVEYLFLFCDWGPKRSFYRGVPNVPKKLANQCAPLKKGKKKKKCDHTHELINMNHT